MNIPLEIFWKRLAQRGVLVERDVRHCAAAWEAMKGQTGDTSAPAAARWLVAQGLIAQADADACLEPIVSPTRQSSAHSRSRQQIRDNSGSPKVVLMVASLAVIAGALFGIWFLTQQPPNVPPQNADRQDSATKPSERNANAVTDDPQKGAGELSASPWTLVDDDGHTLWLSPTQGPPIETVLLPVDAVTIISLRPAELSERSRGQLELAAGPFLRELVQEAQQIIKRPWAAVEHLLIALSPAVDPNAASPFAVTFVVKPVAGQGGLIESWQQGGIAASSNVHGYTVFKGPEWSAAATDVGEDDAEWIIMPTAMMEDHLQAIADPLPRRREFEWLVEASDTERQMTLMVFPRFWEAQGANSLVGIWRPLRELLPSLVADDVQAFSLSAHWGEDLFLEWRQVGTLDLSGPPLRQDGNARLERLPNLVEDALLSRPTAPYGRRLLARFPQMLRLLRRYTRSEVQDHSVVWRSYLPAEAGPNLLAACELLLAETAAADAPAIARMEAPPKQNNPQNPTQSLQQVTSIRFRRESLETALNMISEETGIPVVFDGPALQVEGITKNQTFGLEAENKPAGEILVTILRQANPDKSAESASDPRQKLVYVIQEDAAGEPTILVTTRAAAEQRGETLPQVFVQ